MWGGGMANYTFTQGMANYTCMGQGWVGGCVGAWLSLMNQANHLTQRTGGGRGGAYLIIRTRPASHLTQLCVCACVWGGFSSQYHDSWQHAQRPQPRCQRAE